MVLEGHLPLQTVQLRDAMSTPPLQVAQGLVQTLGDLVVVGDPGGTHGLGGYARVAVQAGLEVLDELEPPDIFVCRCAAGYQLDGPSQQNDSQHVELVLYKYWAGFFVSGV